MIKAKECPECGTINEAWDYDFDTVIYQCMRCLCEYYFKNELEPVEGNNSSEEDNFKEYIERRAESVYLDMLRGDFYSEPTR